MIGAVEVEMLVGVEFSILSMIIGDDIGVACIVLMFNALYYRFIIKLFIISISEDLTL